MRPFVFLFFCFSYCGLRMGVSSYSPSCLSRLHFCLLRGSFQGEELDDAELIDLISENRTISGMLSDYEEGRKMTSLTTGARLADFLGAEMLADKGLNCKLIIANRPYGCPVTDRAIPTMIFKAEPAVRHYWLRKWLKTTTSVELRDVIDWPYYKDRLGKTIQKIITIPAALQAVQNPVPRVAHPDWLQRKVREASASARQTKITAVFKKLGPGEKVHSPHRILKAARKASPESVAEGDRDIMDIEEVGNGGVENVGGPRGQKTALVKRANRTGVESPLLLANAATAKTEATATAAANLAGLVIYLAPSTSTSTSASTSASALASIDRWSSCWCWCWCWCGCGCSMAP